MVPGKMLELQLMRGKEDGSQGAASDSEEFDDFPADLAMPCFPTHSPITTDHYLSWQTDKHLSLTSSSTGELPRKSCPDSASGPLHRKGSSPVTRDSRQSKRRRSFTVSECHENCNYCDASQPINLPWLVEELVDNDAFEDAEVLVPVEEETIPEPTRTNSRNSGAFHGTCGKRGHSTVKRSHSDAVLDVLFSESRDSIREILPQQLVELLAGETNSASIQRVVLIDCRYPYEYAAGHIKKALNIWDDDPTALFEHEQKMAVPAAYVFYCEFSSKRGPALAHKFRSLDRRAQGLNFPKVQFPDVFILMGGYNSFYSSLKNHCDPQGYIPMDAPEYGDELKRLLRERCCSNDKGLPLPQCEGDENLLVPPPL
eukprot:c38918_g1_i1.p1 GENE.c38918_g1_i1~~c38918_g1_i1.p1  ORF type:complete len:381 (-),score=45.12 c38918_g1_i1:63-1175(-)